MSSDEAETAYFHRDDLNKPRSDDVELTTERLITLISETRLFRVFNPARLNRLAEHIELIKLRKGEKLFEEGAEITSLYVLVDGGLLEKQTSRGFERRVEPTEIDPNPVIPATPMAASRQQSNAGDVRTSTATALVDSRLVRIPKDAFIPVANMSGREHGSRDVLRPVREAELRKVLPSAFGQLSETAFKDLSSRLTWRSVSRGEPVCFQGEKTDRFYILVSGRLQVLVKKEGSTESEPIDEFAPGDTVGEMEVITGEKCAHTVIALRDSELVQFSKQQFDSLTGRFPKLWQYISNVMVHRLKNAYLKTARSPLSRNILIVPAVDGMDLNEFTGELRQSLQSGDSSSGSCLVLTSQVVDRRFGERFAQSTDSDRQHLRLKLWLSEQERSHEVILFQTDGTVTEWTQRCIRSADEVIYVAPEGAAPQTGAVAAAVRESEPAHDTRRRKALVLQHDPQIVRPSGTSAWLDEFGLKNTDGSSFCPGRPLHLRRGHAADYARIGRYVTRREVGLVLSGGGARGFAHVGCIRAMKELGIPIDMIAGVSMGSVVSAAYAFDPEQFEDRISVIASQLGGVLTDFTFPYVSIAKGARFDRRLKSWFGDVLIEDLWLPYFCVTSNLTRARIHVHDAGPLWWSVRASGTLPGVSSPVIHEGDLLFDGCLLDNLPMDVMRDRMYESYVVAVDVVPPHDLEVDVKQTVHSPSGIVLAVNRFNPFAKKKYGLPGIFSVLQRAGELGSVYGRQRLIEGKYADQYLHPPVDKIHIADFKEVERAAEIGYEHCLRELSEWWSKEQAPAR